MEYSLYSLGLNKFCEPSDRSEVGNLLKSGEQPNKKQLAIVARVFSALDRQQTDGLKGLTEREKQAFNTLKERLFKILSEHGKVNAATAATLQSDLQSNEQVTVQSQSGEEFSLDVERAKKSKTLADLIEAVGTENPLPMPNIDSPTLKFVVAYLQGEIEDAPKALAEGNVIKILTAANYLDIPNLLADCISAMKTMTEFKFQDRLPDHTWKQLFQTLSGEDLAHICTTTLNGKAILEELARPELEVQCQKLAAEQWNQYFTKLGWNNLTIEMPPAPPKEMETACLVQFLISQEATDGPVVAWIPPQYLQTTPYGTTEAYPFGLSYLRILAQLKSREHHSGISIMEDWQQYDTLMGATSTGCWVVRERLPLDSLGRDYEDLRREAADSGKVLLHPIEEMAIQHLRWVLYEDDICGVCPEGKWATYGNYALCDLQVTSETATVFVVLAGMRDNEKGFSVNLYPAGDRSEGHVGAAPARKFPQ